MSEFVTIIADASHCFKKQVGGYGFWVASSRGKTAGGGELIGTVENSFIAELMAICKAVHGGLTAGLIQPDDIVLIQTDCVAAITALRNNKAKGEAAQNVIDIFHGLRRKYELQVRYKHVKGHTGRREPRYAANWHCDRRARQGLQAARERFNNEVKKQNENQQT